MSLPVKLCLAPMAGVTDRAFRQLAMHYGATLSVSEMISIKGLYYNDKKTHTLLEHSDSERPFSVQLFGHEPELFGETVEKALEYGGDFIDINCGCPARKIISGGDGGALMKNPRLIGKIVRAAVEKSPVPVSVKMRLGFDADNMNYIECAKESEANGAAFIAVHGRTVMQQYTGSADFTPIAELVRAVNIPVIANGDITCCDDAKNIIRLTDCAGIMIGRASLGNPYIFRQLSHFLQTGEKLPPLSAHEKIVLAKRHIGLIVNYKGEAVGIKEARKHALWYVKGIHGSVKYKNELVGAKTYFEMCGIFDRLSESLRR